MKLDLKTTILLSSLLAVALNVCQFINTSLQRKEAFTPTWLSNTAATPAPISAKASGIQGPASSTAAPTATVDAATAKLIAAGLKPAYAALYLSVQDRTGTPWQLLAAVHKVESGQRGDTAVTSYAGAQGPMQFMPATFRHYAADGDGNGTTTITDVDDAMLTAGRYLAAGGAARGQYSTALYHYNHSWSYVSHVTGIARKLGL